MNLFKFLRFWMSFAMTSKSLRRIACVSMGLFAFLHLSIAAAHPLGQNTFNRQAAITLGANAVRLHYQLDLAEIPTVAAGEDADTNHDGDISDAEWQAYADRWVQTLPAGLVLMLDGRRLDLHTGNYHWAVKAGTAGFSTLRMDVDLDAPMALGEQAATIEYRDQTRADRLGWKEVWIAADRGVRVVSADVPDHDRSHQLTDFTLRDGGGPPDELAAHAQVLLVAGSSDDSAAVNTIDAAAANGTPGSQSAISSTAPVSAPTHWSIAWSFFRLGMHHIATGWDHLMFLLGLILLCVNLRQLVKTITAFTLAHSVTLALAAEGWVRPPGAWVEGLIALTIAYVGIVALVKRDSQHGARLAFGFGLIHGFGFAGALAESLGASQSLRLVGLVTFNLGIETFQLMLVCMVVPALRFAQRFSIYPYLRNGLASVVVLAGTGWLLERTLGEGPIAISAMVVATIGLISMISRMRIVNGSVAANVSN